MISVRLLASRSILSALVWAFALAAVRAAPQDASGVQGTVLDQTGAVVQGATVTLQGDTVQPLTTTTDARGRYAFRQVPPGRYSVIVKYEGFLDFTGQVELKARDTRSFDVRLMVAGISVTAEVRSNDTRKSLSTLVLSGRDLEALPDDPERLLQRILEFAGSTGRPGEVPIFVDGFREYKRLPPKNTIEMIRISSNPFSAEFAQQGLDRIEIITKPGSDTFHGEFKMQGGDSALDERNPLATTKPVTRTRNYNGYLQGPILKGRLDFIAYGGSWQQDENAVVHATVFDPESHAATLLATTAPMPARITSAMAGTNFQIANQRVNVTFTRNEETRGHQGLDTGLELPEYGYDRSTVDDIGRVSWTSVLGPRLLNDVRVEVTRNAASASPLTDTPALQVLDAFYAGGNQTAGTRSTTTGTQTGDTLTMQFARHVIKTGVLFETTDQDSFDRSGFGGTFIFGTDVERDALGNPLPNATGQLTPISPIDSYQRTVQGLPGYGPSEFWIVRGNPDVSVRQWSLGAFALDDWTISKRLSVSYGVRQDRQSNVSDRGHVEPRASLSWLLDEAGKNAIKLGAGVFYGKVEPGITLQTNKVNGVDRQQFIVARPSDYPALPALDGVTPVQSAIYTKADDLRVPHSFIASLSFERQLPRGLFAVAQYTYNEGTDLLRLRNVAADASDGASGAAIGPNLQFESTGRSLQRQLMLGLRGNISRDLTWYVNYTYGRKMSDTDGPYTTPANSGDLSTEYGPAADDQRHQFVAGGTFNLTDTLQITPSVLVTSGRPFNITTGRDNNGDTLFSDRPAFASPDATDAIATPYGLLNPNPQPGDVIIPRNLGREPKQVTVNLSISQTIAQRLVFALDADNVLNNRRLFQSNGVLTSPTFGMPNQALDGRRLLLSFRYGF